MNPTFKLLRTIDSPFKLVGELLERKQALELYDYAVKNKIGLFYLKAIKDQGKLEEFGLESEYRKEHAKHSKQLITVRRIAKFLNSMNVNYAVFKSILPYPATPNDVDILYLGSSEEYKKVVETLLKNGYISPRDGSGPHVVMLHDRRARDHDSLHGKDVYDIDLYNEVAISHVVYLDKGKLAEYVTDTYALGGRVKVLKPEVELLASIVHSVIPEQLFTLFVHYATLYYLEKMGPKEIRYFVDIAEDSNVVTPIRAHLSMVAALNLVSQGFVPDKIEEILAKLGEETREKRILIKNNFKAPHRYSWSILIRTLLEMMKGKEFQKSIAMQMVHMLKPKFANYVVGQLAWRRNRVTY